MKQDMAHQTDSRMWMSNSKTTVRRLCRFGCGLMLVVAGWAPGVLAAQPDSKPAVPRSIEVRPADVQLDGRRDVANRLRGAWGFPAPYGHEPIGLVGHEQYRVAFNLDIVGGTVGSLCEAYRETTQFGDVGHRVNLLLDHETEHIRVRSPYTNPALEVTIKRPGPLFVRIPSWVDDDQLRIPGYEGVTRRSNGYLLFQRPPVNRPISIEFPLSERETILNSVAGSIRAQLRGDSVAAMDNLDADLTFFDPL